MNIEKFLIAIDPDNNQLYILHRQYPACLIWIKQEIPVRFIILDLYDEVENVESILIMPFIQEAKDFYQQYAEKSIPGN